MKCKLKLNKDWDLLCTHTHTHTEVYGHIVKLYFYVNKRNVLQVETNSDVASTTKHRLPLATCKHRFVVACHHASPSSKTDRERVAKTYVNFSM